MSSSLPPSDLDLLRRLAERKLAIANDPVNQERKRAWYALDAGEGDRPMILAEHFGVRDKRLPVPEALLHCADPWARNLEQILRTELYRFETLQDDHVIEPVVNLGWKVTKSDYGVQVVEHQGGDEELMGAKSWEPPIQDLDKDFAKLRPRTFSVDREATMAEQARLETVFKGLLPVRIRGNFYWTMGLTNIAIRLIGLEQLMLAMYDHPAGLHRLLAFLRDDNLAFADWLEREGLYTLNHENDYIGSGSMGYTKALPQQAGAKVRTQDLWVLVESQETVGVGPDQYAEFVFPYEESIARRFGRLYYGCCEPVHTRWHVLKRFPNLARVSVSPWADQAFMAEACGRDYVFSRKPNPSLVSTGVFDEQAIRADLRQTLAAAGKCRLEIIMKDVHTLNNEPERLPRWVAIAREECGK